MFKHIEGHTFLKNGSSYKNVLIFVFISSAILLFFPIIHSAISQIFYRVHCWLQNNIQTHWGAHLFKEWLKLQKRSYFRFYFKPFSCVLLHHASSNFSNFPPSLSSITKQYSSVLKVISDQKMAQVIKTFLFLFLFQAIYLINWYLSNFAL